MTYRECVAAVHSMTMGRACVVTEDGPFLMPVEYVVLNEQIYFRVQPGSVLATHADNRRLAIEVDEIFPDQQVGWSVLARGIAHAVADDRTAKLSRSLGSPKPWVTGPDMRLFNLVWTQLTGRRMEDWQHIAQSRESPPRRHGG